MESKNIISDVPGAAHPGTRKILIAYASSTGTTSEVAQAIGQEFCDDNTIVETKQFLSVKDVSEYDAVIIGSPIRYDRWMPEATNFVVANQDKLSKLPVAFFFTCLTLSRQNENTLRQAQVYSDKLRGASPQIKPVDVGGFAGVLNIKRMPFVIGLIFRVAMAILRVPEGDYRDWSAIRSWAKNIKQTMGLQSVEHATSI